MPWWFCVTDATSGFPFQAPDIKAATSEANTAGGGLLESAHWNTQAEAIAAAKQAGITNISTAGGGGGSGGGLGGGAGSGGTRQDVVNEALNSIGHAYQFGGAPGVNGDQPWDCSSCVNNNVGRVNRLAIPGYPAGSYDGSVHGPSTIGWLDAQGGVVGSIDRSLAEGGDIACWRTHMGMFINHDEMVSAENPADGTRRSFVDGFIQGEQLIVLRLAHFGPGGITLPVPTIGGNAHLEQITRQIAESDRNLVARQMRIVRIGKGRF